MNQIFTWLFIFLGFVSSGFSYDSHPKFWPIQSIDTMKYSRDLAREKLNDATFDTVIDRQVKNIADTSATHVAIGTPYDEEFIPILKRWVTAARKYRLHVWFRGNFSGWEKWFGYPSISREEHIAKTKNFILKHKDLFEDGDIFTSCVECENGGPGDPRETRDVAGYRRFLIENYKTSKSAFAQIGKKVQSNAYSMNGDIARLIMDKETTAALDGVVTVDHYVAGVDKLVKDIKDFSSQSGGKILLGEYGAPIPDINGNMTEKQQAEYLKKAFSQLAQTDQLIGVNYWVSEGGSTQLWKDNKPREAVSVIKSFYSPRVIKGFIKNEIDEPIANTRVQTTYNESVSDAQGKFQLPILSDTYAIKVIAPGYIDREVNINGKDSISVVMTKQNETKFYTVIKFFKNLFKIH